MEPSDGGCRLDGSVAQLPRIITDSRRLSDGETPSGTPAAFGGGPTPKSTLYQVATADTHKQAPQEQLKQEQLPAQHNTAVRPAAATSSRQVNGLLKRAGSPDELLSAVAQHWHAMDSINLCCAFNRLAKMAEQLAEPAAFRQLYLDGNSTFSWLLDNLQAACYCLDFNTQCTVNALASVAKLQCSTPALVAALIAPLQRCLSSQTDPLAPFALSNLVWALAKDFSTFKPAFLAVKGWLLGRIWQYCAAFDPQALSMLFWALGEISQGTTNAEFDIEAEAPCLLHYLGVAVQQQAAFLGFQSISNIIYSCSKMRPPFRDTALLEQLAAAALWRLQGGMEQISTQSIGNIAYGMGKLSFTPACVPVHNGFFNLLDELGFKLCPLLHCSKPQEVSSYLHGLALLDYSPAVAILQSILTHLAQPNDSATSLTHYSPVELSNLAGAIGRFLGSAGNTYCPMAEQALQAFFSHLDAVLLAQLSGPNAGSPSPQHIGNIFLALSRLPVACHAAAPSPTTLAAVELHVHQQLPGYNSQAVCNVLRFFATRGLAPSQSLLEDICSQFVRLMDDGTAPVMSISFMVWALGCLRICHEPLLSRYMNYVQGLVKQQPLLHPADASRLVFGTAALAASNQLPSCAASQLPAFWSCILSSMERAVQTAPQQLDPHAASLLKPEELRMIREAYRLLTAHSGQPLCVPASLQRALMLPD